MPKYYIWTIGCQMNKAESERLSSRLENMGYQKVSAAAEADLILLNSCVVRQSAENKVLSKLQALKSLKKTNPKVSIALTGCLVNSDTDQRQQFPFVDHYFKAGEIPSWLAEVKASDTLPSQPAVATYVPIMKGCNNFCSYCIVPYRRGREISRMPDDVVCEVNELVRRGVREVTLVGQNVDSYGRGLPQKPDLADLLSNLNCIEGLWRIRFLTNHPKDMSPRLIDAIASLDKVCEQINLPVQAGDNDILRAMRREYTTEHYRHLVQEIRSKVPDIAITTDVIVGFPGESREQFENTFNLLSELRFDAVHVAAYSPRSGTFAARELADDVALAVKKERLSRIEELQKRIAGEINALLADKTVAILVEKRNRGKWEGRTRSDKIVFFDDDNDFLGKLVNIRITRTSPWSLTGKVEALNPAEISKE